MKKIALTSLLSCFALFIFAQNSTIVNYTKKDNASYTEGYVNPNPAAYNETHTYLKNRINRGNSSQHQRINTIPLGTAGNLFTILAGEVNRVAANNVINSVVFIHRSDPSIFPSSNVGQYRYDVSTNGGSNWTLNQDAVLNPSGNQLTLAGRYPNAVIHNPMNNTNPDSAYMAYIGPWLPFDLNGDWDGQFHGVARLDNDTATYTETITTPSNGDIDITRGMCNGAPGVFWAVNFHNSGTSTDAIFDAILIFKGVWNPFINDVDWIMKDSLAPTFDKTFDGSPQVTGLNMAFDPTGQYGWVCATGDIAAGGINTFNPFFYKTTNGGNTWTGPIEVDLFSLNNVIAGLVVSPEPTTAFDSDIAVDEDGNPHMLITIGSSGQDYAISTGTGAGMKMYDITYFDDADPGYKWHAMLIDSVQTFRGDITVEISEDNRPQVLRTEVGNKVFFGWLDSDPTITGGGNDLPNFITKGYDVNTGLATPTTNWTEGDINFDGQALFASTAQTVLSSAGSHNIPTVIAQLNPSGSEEDPASFFYINDIVHTDASFTEDIRPPVINLIGANPLTIVNGSAYNEPGANAFDNVDGNISGSIVINSSAVNTNVNGTYEVTYNVSDAAGNIANEVTRAVNVVASPDNTPPTITLTGDATITLDVCDSYGDPGATATDDVDDDADVTNNIVVTSNLPSPLVPGTFTVDYDVQDGAGNAATTVSRTVVVENLPPTITLSGSNPTNIEVCNDFTDPKAIGFDNCLGALGVAIGGDTVDTDVVGTYTITYTVTDGVNPPVTVNRVVNVTPDVTPPVITLNGTDPYYVYLGDAFNDPGANAMDCVNGNLPVTTSGSVNASVRGSYTVRYNAMDSATPPNAAVEVTREVIVNTEPDADFTYQVNSGLQVSFTDASLYNPDKWTWKYGNGNGSLQPNPTTTYGSEGTYEVCLTAENIFNRPPFSKDADSTCKNISVINVGIEEALLEKAFTVYPNPTSGKLLVEIKSADFDAVQITVSDLAGRELSVVDLDKVTVNTLYTLNLENYPSGTYFVKLGTTEGSLIKKIALHSGK